MTTVVPLAVLVAIAWVIISLPARKQRRAHAEMQDTVGIGEEIISAGGIHGTILEAGPEDVRVEIAPGVVVTLDRRAIAAVAQDDPPVEELESESEPEAETGPAEDVSAS